MFLDIVTMMYQVLPVIYLTQRCCKMMIQGKKNGVIFLEATSLILHILIIQVVVSNVQIHHLQTATPTATPTAEAVTVILTVKVVQSVAEIIIIFKRVIRTLT